jgi:hypothetical protein
MISTAFELLAASLFLVAAVGVLWRFRARKKWRELLDAYAEEEIALSRRNVHARSQS